ncbi:DeoR family transcriptional regulator [Chelativorans sp. ZYF759]|uniref:DeoR/GlpR family DNA-binding transcription regulator n=1 Tax=Chelativorans sp. ZYF759 TaxID=2692213 RepID=UPI00145D43FC|nr:DeoR/GlpR family DNA-binding transcription regulator [Chelativorans sp. ZYF759]NMG40366.1 DeoR family transcriptional regulator [Chelativorans sp. ZYF759]
MSIPVSSQRRTAILAEIEARGFVTLEALAEAFAVSMQTVRRDVIAMHEEGLIERFHGGAGAKGRIGFNRVEHRAKRSMNVQEKREIAGRVAAMLPEGAFAYFDVGTTLEAVAAALRGHPRITVVTNSLHVATLVDPAEHEIRMLPGRVAGPDGSVVGEDAILALQALRLDVALIGCSAIETDGQVMDFDPAKIAVKRTAMGVARRNLLLATRDKFGQTARCEIAHTSDFSEVITETTADVDET